VALLRIPVLLDPGCARSFAAWPLAGTHHCICLHAFSHASSVLFLRKVLRLSIRKEEGGG
jgi:hypothetical protein